MRNLRIFSPQFSRIRRTFIQYPCSDSPSIRYLNFLGSGSFASSSSLNHRNFTTASLESRPAHSERVSGIVDEISGLTLLDVADLTEVLRGKLDVKDMPVMAVMMPGMGFGGLQGVGKGGLGAKGGEEKKTEKTAFDVKLEAFDAASKIKVIKEVRTFTNLGLKEAKDLVEKAPMLLKKGVTKEEADTIIAKMKEVGAKVSVE
ncbi:uncharacterized protein LOC111453206 [Cucurbita moschata]|uniref:Uncharacterized protein LOC111453206 n=2 Tax=Cucurbita TaxID=3660 RepID=A0A6J1GDL5_CUCMO